MLQIGIPELVVIFLAIFLLFGPNALLQIARTIGEFVKKMRNGFEEMQKEISADESDKKDRNSSSPTKPV